MLKKLLFFFSLIATFILAGCASNNNTLDISPKIQVPKRDPSLNGITISIDSADQRSDQALAKVNRDGQLITLTPSRNLRFLLQETLEKQMKARGYLIEKNSIVNLKIVVNGLYADVTQGNVRHRITTKADFSIITTAKNGSKQVKNYRQTNSVQGAFFATNQKITKAVNQNLTDVIFDMMQDISVNEFIKQNAC